MTDYNILRFLLLATVLLTSTVYGQTKYFDTNKLDSVNLVNFLADKEVIVIGEMHGTTEVPLFVLELVRQLQVSQRKLTVGLEIPINHQKDIDKFLETGNFSKLLKLDYFRHPDGRTSVAMGQLIRGIREIKGLKVICFDIESGAGPEVNRDSLMGVNLSKSYKGEQMVILTGNLHANLKHGYWRPNFKSAVFYFNNINKFDNKLISLNTYFGSGTIWICMQDGCKERDAGSNSNLKQTGLTNFLAIYEGVHPSGYSGYAYFDTVTASKPLVY
jgi:hypothetical protein